MATVIYRDLACASGQEFVFKIFSRLVSNGYQSISWSDGTTRTGSGAAPAAASDLSASDSWWVIKHSTSNRHYTVKNTSSGVNWIMSYTPYNKSISAGDATTPDNHASYTKNLIDNQKYPNSGTTDIKLHLVIDSVTGTFYAFGRRTPFVGGDTAACIVMFSEIFTPLTWPDDPEPVVTGFHFNDNNNAQSGIVDSCPFNRFGKWRRYGISGETWENGTILFSSLFSAAGNTTLNPSGQDVLYDADYGDSNMPGPIGKSSMLKMINPYRSPIVGVDSGGELNWAAFGQFAIPNDGIALGS